MFVVDVSSLMPPPVKVEPAAPTAAADGEETGSQAVKMDVDAAAATDSKPDEAAANAGVDAMETDKPAAAAEDRKAEEKADGAAAEKEDGAAAADGDATMTDAAEGEKVRNNQVDVC